MNITKIGLIGEWKAERYLKKCGMHILERRYRAPHGEIDLIAAEGDILVFVEVKYRPCGTMGDGQNAVDFTKAGRLRYTAEHYLAHHPADLFRFDVIEITSAGIRHIKNAL